MITNCTITRIDTLSEPAEDNTRQLIEGQAISVRVAIDRPTTSQKWLLGASVQDASAVIYGVAAELAACVKEGFVNVTPDEQPAARYKVLHIATHVKGSLTHREIYLKQQ